MLGQSADESVVLLLLDIIVDTCMWRKKISNTEIQPATREQFVQLHELYITDAGNVQNKPLHGRLCNATVRVLYVMGASSWLTAC